MKLFVYGSLMRGESAHHLLGDATWVCALRTDPSYTLVLVDGYPGLVDGGRTAVAGEIYALSPEDADARLAKLDEYEDVPELYTRELRAFGEHQAWVYLLLAEQAQGRTVIASGDWRAR